MLSSYYGSYLEVPGGENPTIVTQQSNPGINVNLIPTPVYAGACLETKFIIIKVDGSETLTGTLRGMDYFGNLREIPISIASPTPQLTLPSWLTCITYFVLSEAPSSGFSITTGRNRGYLLAGENKTAHIIIGSGDSSTWTLSGALFAGSQARPNLGFIPGFNTDSFFSIESSLTAQTTNTSNIVPINVPIGIFRLAQDGDTSTTLKWWMGIKQFV